MKDFHFSPDYHVDEILFRHILGTVTNANYIKPKAAYSGTFVKRSSRRWSFK